MRRMKRAVLASALFIGLGLGHGEATAQFSGFYFFGDSLSDAGSFKPVLPPGTGKFATNPGPIWAEVIAHGRAEHFEPPHAVAALDRLDRPPRRETQSRIDPT